MYDDNEQILTSPISKHWKIVCIIYFIVYALLVILITYSTTYLNSLTVQPLFIKYDYPNEIQIYFLLLCGLNFFVVYNKVIEIFLSYHTTKQAFVSNYTGLTILITMLLTNILLSFPTLAFFIFGEIYFLNDGFFRTIYTSAEWVLFPPMVYYICMSYDCEKEQLYFSEIILIILAFVSMMLIYSSKLMVYQSNSYFWGISYGIGAFGILFSISKIQYQALIDCQRWSTKFNENTQTNLKKANENDKRNVLTKTVSFRLIENEEFEDHNNELRFPVKVKESNLSPRDKMKKEVTFLRFQLCFLTGFIFVLLSIVHSSRSMFLSLTCTYSNSTCENDNDKDKLMKVNTLMHISCSVIKIIYLYIISQDQALLLNPTIFNLLLQKYQNEMNRNFLKNNLHEIRELLHSIYLSLSIVKEEYNCIKYVSPTKTSSEDTIRRVDSNTESFNDTISITSNNEYKSHLSLNSFKIFSNENVDSCNESLNIIEEAINFMDQTLQDVISIREIEQGTIELKLDYFVIQEIIYRISKSLKGQLALKEITLLVQIDENVPPMMFGDRFRIEHVLANLLSNAIKFSDMKSDIIIKVCLCDNDVKFSVIDQGIGISIENQKLLFNNYVQFNPGINQKGNGTGIGLAICKETIRLHGGIVGCNSKLREGNDIKSGGSEFYFQIPLQTQSINSLSSKPSDNSLFNEKYNLKNTKALKISTTSLEDLALNQSVDFDDLGSGKTTSESVLQSTGPALFKFFESVNDNKKIFRALIVDDSLSNRKILQVVLKRKGVECDVAHNGKQCVQKFRSKQKGYYDFILMDNLMPDMNGTEAVQILRKEGYKNIIIGLTGNAMQNDIEDFENAGVDIVFAKPLRINDLDEYLHRSIHSNFMSPKHCHF